MEYNKLDENVKFILKLLQKNGQGVIVGGAVRDSLLNLKPKDYDFATDIPYDKLKKIFKSYRPIEMGKHFGIIQIKIRGIEYEIAKFRIDVNIPEDRKKQKIEFTDNLMIDLQRRDFTINSIAFNGTNLIYGNEWCKYDIENKILRFMGDPMIRIKEDPLRLFRGVRFISTKNLNPKHLLGLSNENFDVIQTLSKERIKDEFNKIIVSDSVELAFELFEKLKLWKYIDPQIEEVINSDKKEYYKMIIRVKSAKKQLHLRLACLLQNMGEVAGRTFLSRLKYSKKSIDIIIKLIINYHPEIEFDSPIKVKRIIKNIGHENIEKYIDLYNANISLRRENIISLKKFKIEYKKICKNKEPIEIKDLKVTGMDLLELNIKGKDIGKYLEYLMSIVLENPNLNIKENLLEICKEKLIRKHNFS